MRWGGSVEMGLPAHPGRIAREDKGRCVWFPGKNGKSRVAVLQSREKAAITSLNPQNSSAALEAQPGVARSGTHAKDKHVPVALARSTLGALLPLDVARQNAVARR
jgi:hypothetical protein